MAYSGMMPDCRKYSNSINGATAANIIKKNMFMKLADMILAPAIFLVLAVSCTKDYVHVPDMQATAVFRIGHDGYDGNAGISGLGIDGSGSYDRVEFMVTDEDGDRVGDIKGYYDAAASEIRIERLYEGSYRLSVIGIRGEWESDGAVFRDAGHESDVWLEFTGAESGHVNAEYFHASVPFSVVSSTGPDGNEVSTEIPGKVQLRRIIGRTDFNVHFRNPYIEKAVISVVAEIAVPQVYRAFAADGTFKDVAGGNGQASSGKETVSLDLLDSASYFMLPSRDGQAVPGKVGIQTRDYRGNTVRRIYAVDMPPVTANRINSIEVDAIHPDDGSGTMFITESFYAAGDHGRILQDDEPHEIYTDKALRNFNTSRPLQVWVSQDSSLNVRFYSPKALEDVLVMARIPSEGDFYFDLAYFDVIPAFADFSSALPVLHGKGLYRTDSGKIVEIPRKSFGELDGIEFRIVSGDPYWEKLSKIIHGWNIRFDLFGGDPTLPDGGPQGNWMGIRPVHCREAVAFFLNFTYMIDMPEHEQILYENQDRLYGNGGVDDKVPVETILGQMRQTRTINVGLVYPGNGVVGLGGGSTFGAYQDGWITHYTSLYSCEIMFHELGHVMGYSHNSSFTYGPWAQELMNSFYVSHISEMPVDSPRYLSSSENVNLYK